nr:MAG TPA: hypothetical protein [Caudoviricetes sp.]
MQGNILYEVATMLGLKNLLILITTPLLFFMLHLVLFSSINFMQFSINSTQKTSIFDLISL